MIKFIHTGDIHLGLQFNNVTFDKDKAMKRRHELWSTFQRIIKYSIEKSIDFLFIAGDLFEDAYFTLGDIKRVRDILAEAKDVNILISAGNHDNINQKSLYRKVQWSNNVTIFSSEGIDKKEFSELNTIIYGYSWDRLEYRENNLFNNLNTDKTKNNILILHGDISKESNYLPLTIAELKKLDMDYIALGHIHKPNMFSNNIAYCGCPEPLDFGEIGKRGFIEGTIDNGITRIDFVPFSQRNFHTIEISIDETMGYLDIVRTIQAIEIGNLKEDFYRITLKGYIQNDISFDNIEKEIHSSFYHLELYNETIPDYDLEVIEKANQENIIGQFIKSMRSKGLDNEVVKDALYIGLDVLLKGRD